MDGDPPSKVGYRRATRKYMLTSRFTAYDPTRTSTALTNGYQVVKSFRYLLTDPRQFDILQSRPLASGDRMQFDQLKRREFLTLLAARLHTRSRRARGRARAFGLLA